MIGASIGEDLQPAELAALVDFAERPRVADWSLRSAVVRYAQPQPARASRILDGVRRLDAALRGQRRRLQADGPDLWAQLTAGTTSAGDRELVDLLAVATRLDRLGDVLATWAASWPGDPPDADVDTAVAEVGAALDRLGVPADEPPPEAFMRRRARGRSPAPGA